MSVPHQAFGSSGNRGAELASLMVAAQAGDRIAYQALLRACVPIAAAIVRRQGIAPAHVDDVVQDTLLTVHRARATYDPGRPFLPWLSAIAQRRAIDLMRKQNARAACGWAAQTFEQAQTDHQPLASELMERADRARQLGLAVEALPCAQREAVQRLGLMEQTLAEASKLTGRSAGALKVSLHRGLNSLRGMLVPQPGASA